MTACRSIPVRDGNGYQLSDYEFRDRRFLRRIRRLELCTGELVMQLDQATFAIAATERAFSQG